MSQPAELDWNPPNIRVSWQWDLQQLQAWQLQQLNAQFDAILPHNTFYRQKFAQSSLRLDSLQELTTLPFTTKQELVASAEQSEGGISGHHTYPPEAYSRLHRTSGTTGNPLMILDTAHDWQRWSWTWQHVLEAADIAASDRAFLAFSFGPFIGFWSAHQAFVDRGALAIPGGGLSTLGRLEFMKQTRANVLCCTPSYALYMAEVASKEQFALTDLAIAKIIVAGESGGSVPSVRRQLEETWNAQIIDHSGATEVGPWGFGWADHPGLHINEASFIAELIPLDDTTTTDDSSSDNALHELVLTSLTRLGAPVIRYRTGDAVIATRPPSGPCRFLWLPQGVVGRTDNMVTIRGVNVFPSSLDAVVRDFREIVEYQVQVSSNAGMDQLLVRIEAGQNVATALQKQLNIRLGLRIPVETVAQESLPRSELKSRRWLDCRH